nr:hypothetical protein [Tanacetum cinerariifolium]
MHGYTTWWEHGETKDTFHHMGQCSNAMEDDEVDAATHMELNNPTDYNLGLSSEEEEVQEEEIPSKFAQSTRYQKHATKDNELVENFYEAKKCSKEISLPVKKIHACKKHCMLFYDADASLTYCRWCGVDNYDAYRRQNFRMKAILLWMVSDFPAYAMLLGWSTHGKLACPHCMGNIDSFQLQHGGKSCWFDCHRRFLPIDHAFRHDRKGFQAKTTVSSTPPPELNGFKIWHNLDVMHIEKNVFENIFNTIMDTSKTKDNIKARMDIEKYCDRADLHVWKQNNKVLKTKASYTLSKPQVKKVCEWLKNVKFPNGYASNIRGCVNLNDSSFYSFKIHECHVFMQRLLSIALKGMIPNAIWDAITELCTFFCVLCSKELHIEDLETLKDSIVVTLYKLEKVFPPGLFDSMEHLVIHLVNEAINGGPEQYRWMYLYERSDPRNEHFKDLAYGPINEVTSHKGYIVNGYKFHTLAHGGGRVTNNTGNLKDWWAVVKAMPKGIFQVAEGILATEISNDDNVDEEEFFQENDRLVCTIGITEDIQQVTLVREEIEEVQTALVTDDTNDNGEAKEFEDMNGDDDSSDDIDLDSSNHFFDDDA